MLNSREFRYSPCRWYNAWWRCYSNAVCIWRWRSLAVGMTSFRLLGPWMLQWRVQWWSLDWESPLYSSWNVTKRRARWAAWEIYNCTWCDKQPAWGGGGENQAYSRLATPRGHITDCKLDSVVYAGVCMWVNVDLSCLGRTIYAQQFVGAKPPIQFRHRWAGMNHSDHLYWLRAAQSVA